MTTQPLLQVEDLNVYFKGTQGRFHAVKNLSFAVGREETLALVGESGCGKSTTALAIMQLLAPGASLSGKISLGGDNLLSLAPRDMRKLRGSEISMIFQEPMTSLNPVYNIGWQIAETLRQHEHLSAKAARQRVIELLDLVRIPEPQRRIDDYPHQLSGGQRQRVMIAMAVACKPALLIADEPTTALDVTIQAQVLELLDKLRRDLAMGVLLITHDLGVVAQWADRVAVMYGGEQVEEGATQSLFQAPAHPYTQGLLGASLHGGKTLHYSEARLPEIRTDKDANNGHNTFTLHTPALPEQILRPQPQTLLSVRNLRTDYQSRQGVVHAVNDVSFDITAGQSVGLVGESGSGKSTLCKTLLRLIPAASGSIVFDGVDVAPLKESKLKAWRRRVQMVFQDPYASLNPRRTVFDILDAVLRVHEVRPAAERNRQIAAILDRVGLPANAAKRYPNEFSGGQRQRIGIARALILKPELVICDEPVSALDVSVQAQILNLLVELKEDFNLSYFFISHDLAVVRYIADHVLVMNAGKIVESSNNRQIWHDPQHAYTRSLIASIPGRRGIESDSTVRL
ncbi:ABC transporter ATP-binding protein [Pusillimonas sp. T7-7]|uniref:ABC transporter ATP-binding protein n=1 Tax=Pusillimonas sp. (strain T7-7) TaxID=1007105 RepID=UPI0002084B45|nr:ABC transporter ATP-binding protein [Pusillimonas sp. T7-7]AEC20503.1 ABC transporter ATP-binding protein [Pusillimonas sp. T7-7]